MTGDVAVLKILPAPVDENRVLPAKEAAVAEWPSLRPQRRRLLTAHKSQMHRVGQINAPFASV